MQSNEISTRNSTEMATQILNSITRAMEEGSNLQKMNEIVESYRRLFPGRYSISIRPSKTVTESSYPLPEPDSEPSFLQGFSGNGAVHNRTINSIQHFFPLKTEAKCIFCHPNAKLGEILGVLSITEDIRGSRNDFLRRFFYTFLFFAPIPFLMAYLVSRFVNLHLGDAVGILDKKVRSINSIADLTKLELDLESEDIKFQELRDIFAEIRKIAGKIKGVAVGKEMLEFEIRVLERFIITSDTIRDWKERVGLLLNEINSVMQAYTIFCVFQIEADAYEIEVFWKRPPSDSTLKTMEYTIKERINEEKILYSPGCEVKISHSIVNPQEAMLEVQPAEIELQTKSLFLNTPQIGGVVGIGVQSLSAADPIRSLVINSILTTMINVVGSIKAIYKYTKDLEYFATRDPLTNLFNQRIFWDLLGYEVSRAERHNYSFGVLMIDLDNFKHINDMYGHFVGDKFLSKAASVIHECLRKGDILARYGGDEFSVVLTEADQEQVYMVADRIRESLEEMCITTVDGAKIRGSASIGMAIFPSHAQTPKDLFLFADNMMYLAKSRGRNCIIIPTENDVLNVFEKSSEMSRILLKVLEEKRVIPYFQPIVGTGNREVACHEVLCRIEFDNKIISASEFIEIAEKLAIITKLDSILMEKVFQKVQETGYDGYLFINLSPKSLIVKEFVPMVIRLARTYNIRHESVVFEITERETVKNMTLLESFVIVLRDEGFKFAIDDFGSGFSSFQYIRRLPIDFVKIEGMFVRNMLSDPKDLSFVKTLSMLAKEFGILTIAEYIESEELLQAVHSLGIDYAQGYHTGIPAPDFTKGPKIEASLRPDS
ncbi:MAG: bifunctional diguanylate cyclase/phosphodiesterase [Desulfuromonadaceae bacterium]|nr:bifunctional diguanylate cyclase/phosphodiesterase [Desulfuromonadaceae bacterium]